jgi:hypothetical protein
MVSVLGMNTFGNVLSIPLFSIIPSQHAVGTFVRPQVSDFEFLGLCPASTRQRVGKLN